MIHIRNIIFHDLLSLSLVIGNIIKCVEVISIKGGKLLPTIQCNKIVGTRIIKTPFISESLSAATQMVLANAIYFKGIWHSMFNSAATIPRPFYLANGETKTTPFMRMRRSFKSAIDNHLGVHFVILPFEVSF